MFHTPYVSYLIYHNLEFLQWNSELSTPLKQDRLFSSFLMHTNFQDSQLVSEERTITLPRIIWFFFLILANLSRKLESFSDRILTVSVVDVEVFFRITEPISIKRHKAIVY